MHGDFVHLISNIPELINENGSLAARAFQLPLNISRSAQHLASSRVLRHIAILQFQDKDRKFDPSGSDLAMDEKQIENIESLAQFWGKAYKKESSTDTPCGQDTGDAIQTFVFREIEFASKLVSHMNEWNWSLHVQKGIYIIIMKNNILFYFTNQTVKSGTISSLSAAPDSSLF